VRPLREITRGGRACMHWWAGIRCNIRRSASGPSRARAARVRYQYRTRPHPVPAVSSGLPELNAAKAQPSPGSDELSGGVNPVPLLS
jgi:hypothetical protein